MASPLVPGGLEIPIKVSGTWVSLKHFQLERGAKVKEVKYPRTGEYVDDSKNILQGLGIEEDEDDDDDVEFQMEIVDNGEIQMS